MRIDFDKEYLKDLYEKGVSDKKHRFQPEVVKKYVKVINIMKNAGRVEDLFPFASLHYEVLNGDMKGTESVRVNDKYRIEFKRYVEGAEVKVTVCTPFLPNSLRAVPFTSIDFILKRVTLNC